MALEPREQRHVLGDRSIQCLAPALIVSMDLGFPLRELRDPLGNGLGEAAAAILFQVPGLGADMGEEPFHLRRIAREQLAVEVARVAADQDDADVEYDDGRCFHAHSSSISRHGHRQGQALGETAAGGMAAE